MVRGCAIELVLPAGVTEVRAQESSDAFVASIDARSLDTAVVALRATSGEARVAWVLPIAKHGARGALGWVLSRSRRLVPLALEDACDALRRAGVVDVRVTAIDGSLGLAVLSGRRSPRLDAPSPER